ncbi:ABC transporter [Ktedonobacteria bacterium brp13]|nr:ABC transporter [Ktedonobacteria bacterium brp13]
MSDLIEVSKLTKNYGRQRGILDVTLTIQKGEVFGFLGPNGAGKTTTIRIFMGLLRPTAGSAHIGGFDCWQQSTEAKRLIGYLPGEFTFDPGLTGAQILSYLGHLRGGVDQNYLKQLVERLDVDPSKRFRAYSRGNKQKIGLIQAFMHQPELLILDEPTSGLDPLNQQEFYKMIAETHQAGRTVFLSSHILPEVEHTCQRVGIIREGELVQISEVAQLNHLKQQNVTIGFAQTPATEWFSAVSGVLSVTAGSKDNELVLSVQGDLQQVIALAAQHAAIHITTHEPNLEEVFLRYYQPAQAATANA